MILSIIYKSHDCTNLFLKFKTNNINIASLHLRDTVASNNMLKC